MHACLHELFAQQARQTPDAVAVESDTAVLTYAELDTEANRLAHHLIDRGAGPDRPVGVCLERSAEMVVAVLGVLKAGGAWVPLDAEYPADRLEFMIRDADIPILVTRSHLYERLPRTRATVIHLDRDRPNIAARSSEPPRTAVVPDNLAYIIYTSGSTGRPKGAMVTHRSLCNVALDFRRSFPLSPGRRILQHMSFSFDGGVFDISATAVSGATLCMSRPGGTVDMPAEIERWGADFVVAPPQLLKAADPSALSALRTVGVGGDVCPVDLARAWSDGRELFNIYGPSECTIVTTMHRVENADGLVTVPIGRPMDGVRLHILDSAMHPVPDGEVGELYIGGMGVARGYLNRPGLTAERFVPDPFGPPGGRLYRSGDLVWRNPDGDLEFARRADDQVKIRGFRVEPGEIEAALRRHPGLADVAVAPRSGGADGSHLVGYLVPRDHDRAPTVAELRQFLSSTLPAPAVPTMFIQLDRLPLSPNGKVDRAALPDEGTRPALGSAYVAPRDAAEHTVAAIFADVLGLERIGVYDDFFALGGDSIASLQILWRMRAEFGMDLSQRAVFDHPTIAALAALPVIKRSAAITPADRSRPLPLSLAQRPRHEPDRRRFPLTWQQRRVFTQGERYGLTPHELGAGFFTVALAYRLTGPVEPGLLGRAVADIVARHAALRTSFETGDGDPVAVTHDDLSVPVPVIPVASEQEITDRVRSAVVDEPFPLGTGPLLRVRLLTVGPRDSVLIVAIHHIVSDGWSFGIFLRELSGLYNAYLRGESPRPPELPMQYGDYALWQSDQQTDDQQAYWRTRLRGLRPLPVPTDRPRDGNANRHSAQLGLELPSRLVRQLHALGASYDVTLHIALAGTIMTFLAGLCDTDDIALGTPIANRGVPVTEQVIGAFTNTLILRVQLDPAWSFPDVLAAVRDTALDAYRNPDVPPEKLVDSGEVPVRVLFALQNAPLSPPDLHGVTAEEYPVPRQASKYDLVFSLTERCGGLSGYLEYRTTLFDESTAQGFAAAWRTLLDDVVRDPKAPTSGLLRHGAHARPEGRR
jgi:amino acid adenylation domain-containing protein